MSDLLFDDGNLVGQLSHNMSVFLDNSSFSLVQFNNFLLEDECSSSS